MKEHKIHRGETFGYFGINFSEPQCSNICLYDNLKTCFNTFTLTGNIFLHRRSREIKFYWTWKLWRIIISVIEKLSAQLRSPISPFIWVYTLHLRVTFSSFLLFLRQFVYGLTLKECYCQWVSRDVQTFKVWDNKVTRTIAV